MIVRLTMAGKAKVRVGFVERKTVCGGGAVGLLQCRAKKKLIVSSVLQILISDLEGIFMPELGRFEGCRFDEDE